MIFLISLGSLCLLFILLYSDLAKNLLMVDGSGFLYVAKRLEDGAILYKDVFITNTPVMPYLTWLYKTLVFGNYSLYYITGLLEVCISSFLIFFITKKLHKSDLIAFLSAVLYLFSFTVTANAFPTGISTCVLLLVLSYWLYLDKRYMWAGLVLSLMVGIKAYTLPFFLAYCLTVFQEDRKKLIPVGIVFSATAFVYMLPTFLFAFPEFLSQTFGYGLVRGTAIEWLVPFAWFVTRDFLIVILGIFTVFNLKKRPYPAYGILFFFIFFVLFRDKHFLYYTLFVPFSVLSLGDVIEKVKKYYSEKIVLGIASVIVASISIFNLPTIVARMYQTLQINNTSTILSLLEKEKPDFLYGVTMGVQGISYASGIPVIDNIADNNELLFQSGKLNRGEVTKKVVSTRTIVVMPARLQEDGKRAYASEIIDINVMLKECRIIHSQEFSWPPANELHLFKCYE